MRITIVQGPDRGKTFDVDEPVVVGRGEDVDVVLLDERTSRRHARLAPAPGGGVEVEDLESTNGTYVDGARITGSRTVAAGASFRIGSTVLRVEPAEERGAHTVHEAAAGEEAVGEGPEERGGLRRPRPVPLGKGSGIDRGPGERAPMSESVVVRLGDTLRRTQRVALAAVVSVVVVVAIFLGVLVFGDSGGGRSISEMVSGATASTAAVNTFERGAPTGGGSGWVLDGKEGLIVTNAHVVNGGDIFTVSVDGQEQRAKLVGVAPCEDLAVLKVDKTDGLKTMALGTQKSLRQGQNVVALGFPASASLGTDLSATAGVVSVVRTKFRLNAIDVPHYQDVIQTDASINPGNSGGPLLTLDGKLVGVNSAGITLLGDRTIQGEGYAIGVDRVREILSTLRTGKSLAWLGLGLSYPREGGLIAEHAVPATPAFEKGLGSGRFLIVGINGRRVGSSLNSYCSAIGVGETGDPVTLTILRPGKRKLETIQLELA